MTHCRKATRRGSRWSRCERPMSRRPWPRRSGHPAAPSRHSRAEAVRGERCGPSGESPACVPEPPGPGAQRPASAWSQGAVQLLRARRPPVRRRARRSLLWLGEVASEESFGLVSINLTAGPPAPAQPQVKLWQGFFRGSSVVPAGARVRAGGAPLIVPGPTAAGTLPGARLNRFHRLRRFGERCPRSRRCRGGQRRRGRGAGPGARPGAGTGSSCRGRP